MAFTEGESRQYFKAKACHLLPFPVNNLPSTCLSENLPLPSPPEFALWDDGTFLSSGSFSRLVQISILKPLTSGTQCLRHARWTISPVKELPDISHKFLSEAQRSSGFGMIISSKWDKGKCKTHKSWMNWKKIKVTRILKRWRAPISKTYSLPLFPSSLYAITVYPQGQNLASWPGISGYASLTWFEDYRVPGHYGSAAPTTHSNEAMFSS